MINLPWLNLFLFFGFSSRIFFQARSVVTAFPRLLPTYLAGAIGVVGRRVSAVAPPLSFGADIGVSLPARFPVVRADRVALVGSNP